jgi:hypothetical protein
MAHSGHSLARPATVVVACFNPRKAIDGIGDRDDETTHDVDELINIWRYFG